MSVVVKKEIWLKLDEEQAAILRDMMQNPLKPDETEEEMALREYIFSTLKEIL